MGEFSMFDAPASNRYRVEVSWVPPGAITVILYEWRRDLAMPSHWAIVGAKHWKSEPQAQFDSVHDVLDTAVWVLAFQ